VNNLWVRVKTSSGARLWVLALAALTLVCLVVGLIAVGIGVSNLDGLCGGIDESGYQTFEPCVEDASSLAWGGVLAVVGLFLAGFTGLAGAVVWSVEGLRRPTDRPAAVTDGDSSAATGGDRAAATNGDRPPATGGDRVAATGSDRAAVTGGDRAVVTGGDSFSATGGDRVAETPQR
jgi:hypothetical protein